MSTRELRGRLAGMHEEMPEWVDSFLGDRGFAWQQLERGELWNGKLPFRDLGELQNYVAFCDPVRFAECVFVELEEDGNPPWRLWDYQKASLRHRGNTIHQCGAEVGKTRRIVVLHLWEAITKRGWSLIAAALDGHLDLIWNEVLGQAALNPWLNAQIDWVKTHVKPYRDLVLRNGNRVHLRPAGLDGAAIRGVHVRQRISMDEAPLVKGRKAWNNFFSRGKPWSEIDLYGTPDGDRQSKFFELCARFEECDPLDPPPPRVDSDDTEPEQRYYTKFRWSKRMQPPPFWSREREEQYIVDYGGRDSSDFQQNVEGHHGDPAQTIFPWHRLSACLRYGPEKVIVKLMIDGTACQLYVDAYRLNPSYAVSSALGDEGGEATADPLMRFYSDVTAAPTFGADQKVAAVARWEELLRPLVGHLAGTALCVGVDYGASNQEPTEILFGEPIGARTRIHARVQAKGMTYDNQEELIRALERILTPRWGWGGDSTGSGSTVEHHLARHLGTESIDYTGFVFNATAIDRDPVTGEALVDPQNPDKLRMVNFKEKGTQLLEGQVQRQELELPYDPDMMIEFSGHTAKITESGKRRFSKKKDHLVDAARCLALRLYLLRVGELGTPPIEHAVLPNSKRDSFALQEAF